MRLLLIVAALAATAGCDDPAVRDRIDNVLDHGSVQAEALCDVPIVSLHSLCPQGVIKAVLFQDGSSLVMWNAYGVTFNERTSDVQGCADLRGSAYGDCVTVADGDVTFDGTCNSVPKTGAFDIETYCTGFNLEAFD